MPRPKLPHVGAEAPHRRSTTFIIAHRLSTIRHADQIILLDNGRIAESGHHDELLLADGAYCRFHRNAAPAGQLNGIFGVMS